MKISIFILCYNEEVILPHTIEHYRKRFPQAEFTIYDNGSTDRSVEIAESLGCKVVPFETNGEIDDFKYLEIKNNCWKGVSEGWVVVCDMDEWLDVDEESLRNEDSSGTTILNVKGYEITSESETSDLSDLDIHNLSFGVRWTNSDKRICFKCTHISEINYAIGAHSCSPEGDVVMSKKAYILKHMKMLGLEYLLKINRSRYERSERMRGSGMAIHYLRDDSKVIANYRGILMSSEDIYGFRESKPLTQYSPEDRRKMEKASTKVKRFIDGYKNETLPPDVLVHKYLEVCNDVLFADEELLVGATDIMRLAVQSWSFKRSSIYRKVDGVITKADLESKDGWYLKNLGNIHHAQTSGSTTGNPFGYLRWLDVFDKIEWGCHYDVVLDEFAIGPTPSILYFMSHNYRKEDGRFIYCDGGPAGPALVNHGISRRPVLHEVNFDMYRNDQPAFFYHLFEYLKENPVDVFYASGPQINSLCNYIKKFNVKGRLGGLLSSTGERLLNEDARFLFVENGYFDHACDHMRCWDGGASFFTCKHRNYHLMDNLAWCEQGPNNELISTDYFNLASPFFRYWNGDYCTISKEYRRCECGRLYKVWLYGGVISRDQRF
jgi:glycosyltransferase involved in cell wall biosynthesis